MAKVSDARNTGMDRSGADAFVYAKASGMLARSFVGKRTIKLFEPHSLQELWSLISDKEMPSLPGALLAKAVEKEAQSLFINQYKSLLQNYSKPSLLLVSLLHFYDYDNLKELGAAVCLGEKQCPELVDISPYNILDYSKWPDLKAMTGEGNLSWYDKAPELSQQQNYDYRLDITYINEIWHATHSLDSSCRKPIQDLIGENFRMTNLLWALRLKIYYEMPKEEILSHLAWESEENRRKMNARDNLACEAMKILDWDVEDYDLWKNWKYKNLLNLHEEGVVWKVDPRWISTAFRRHYVEKAYRLFHLYPFTPAPLVCWFIIKRDELDNIRTASESLRLGIGYGDAMKLAGIQEVK